MNQIYAHRLGRRPRFVRTTLYAGLLLVLLVGLLGPAAMASPVQERPAQRPQTVTLEVEEQSDYSADGFASYGEEITYILRYTISDGEDMTGITLVDDFTQAPPPNNSYLPVTFLYSEGPFEFGNAPPVAPVTPTVDESTPGRPIITWALEDISNHSGGDYIYEIHYHVRVYFDGNGAYRRIAHSASTLSWNEGGPATAEFDVTLLQPANFTLNKTQDLFPRPNNEVYPGDPITWTISMLNQDGEREGTAYDLVITDMMPTRTIYVDYFGPYVPVVSGRYVTWTISELVTGTQVDLGILAQLPLTGNVAHAPLINEVNTIRDSCPGDCIGERDYTASDSVSAYVQNIEIGKYMESPEYHNNTKFQAMAGELITVSVSFTVPDGLVIYNPILRVLLADGLSYESMIDPPSDPSQQIPADDPYAPGGRWTQLTWSGLSTMYGPSSLTYRFVIRANQQYFIPPGSGDIPHNTTLQVVPIVRWADSPDGQVDPNDQNYRQRNTETNDPYEAVKFVRPDLRYQSQSSGSYFVHGFAGGGFGGNANVVFTLTLRNRSGGTPYPTAYEVVFSNTLSPNLTYVGASPPPDAEQDIPGVGYALYWTLTTPISDNEEVYVITATLPPTMVAGAAVTSTAQARYTTFPGDYAEEGNYLDDPYTAQDVIVGGFGVTKQVDPTDNVRIGDEVDYTVTIVLNPGLIMYRPFFEDILPLGFHYVPGSMQVIGGSLVGSPIYTPTTGARELLSWELETIDNTGGNAPDTVLIAYKARMTGKDTDGFDVYAANRNDFVQKKNADNNLTVCWHDSEQPGATEYCLADTISARTMVVQPYLADTFTKSRPDMPKEEYEVGETVRFQVDVRNTGQGPAYEIIITDSLPLGISVQDSWLEGSPPENLIEEPPVGATGVVSWTLGTIDPGQTIALHYDTLVEPEAIPGIWLTNTAAIADYSSQPGSTNPDDRHYKDYDGEMVDDPIPEPVNGERFVVLGLSVQKSDAPYDPTAPGAVLTYTLKFGNTSNLYGATNVRITDTYDARLTYLGAQFAPPIVAIGHDPVARTVVWGVDSIGTGGELDDYVIEVYFLVDKPLDQNETFLVNTAAIDGQGDMTGEVVRYEYTGIRMPYLGVAKVGSPALVEPGQQIDYTIFYNNMDNITGTYPVTATVVWVEDTYDPNVTFIAASPPPYTGTSNRWLIGDLPPGDSGIITVTVQVNRPVPAGVEWIYNDIQISSDEVLPVSGETVATQLRVPILQATVTDVPDPVQAGGQIAYTISYINQGGMTANNVVLKDTLDLFADTLIGTPSPPPSYCIDNVCYWEFSSLPPGEGSTISLLVRVDEVPPSNCQIINTVSLESDEVGPAIYIATTTIDPCIARVYLPVVTKGY